MVQFKGNYYLTGGRPFGDFNCSNKIYFGLSAYRQ